MFILIVHSIKVPVNIM